MDYFRIPKVKNQTPTRKEGKKLRQLKGILGALSKSTSGLTIPEISEIVKISIPTVTKLVNDLLEQGAILEGGKKETDNGRRPAIYIVHKERYYTVGAEVLKKWIHVSVVRVDLETVHEACSREFVLEDSLECLEYVASFIEETIKDSPVEYQQVIGLGIAMEGNVNKLAGQSADYFKKLDISLNDWLEAKLKLPVTIDNHTRALSISEQVLGVAKGADNALIVKVSRNLGLGIIVDRHLLLGAKGFAGNFGHLQLGTSQRLCSCGKKNCLRTEVSGDALYQDLKLALAQGETSIYFEQEKIKEYRYHDVLEAVLKGDALSIKLLIEQGEKLGQALGSMVNLLNPELIVIGGEYVMVKDFFLDAVKAGMRKTALVGSLQDCKVKASKLGRYFSSRGAACMILKEHELINY